VNCDGRTSCRGLHIGQNRNRDKIPIWRPSVSETVSRINLLQNDVNLTNVSTLPCKTWNARCIHATVELLQKEKPELIPPQLWLPKSPDLKPVHNSMRGMLQEKVYKTGITALELSTTVSGVQTPQLRSALTNVITVPRARNWATGVSLLRVREFGTVYPPHCGSVTLNLDTLNDFKGISVWRDRGALVTFWFECAVCKSIYLLTLLTYRQMASAVTT